ncbi:MAG: GIY-YIG nuclease family protein [Eubacteriaceae bacterium]|nr:GIY-YIG nuclease family protein [Eubacteriaceae bacterium]
MEYFTYMLECSDGTIYTGWTINLNKRLAAHNAGKASRYTRSRLPAKLLYFERYTEPSAARKREVEIKKLTRAQKKALANTKE